jgi:hypothetical protein
MDTLIWICYNSFWNDSGGMIDFFLYFYFLTGGVRCLIV